MKYFLPIILAILSLTCRADTFEGWTDSEKNWFIASEVAQIVDYQTTRNLLYVQGKYKDYYEQNPLLGRHPSQGKLNTSEIVTLTGNYFLADYLSHEYRTKYLQVILGLESFASIHNFVIGARITF